MLVLARKLDEVIVINDEIKVKIIGINGDVVKIGIEAPKNVKIYREEIWKNIQEENIAAVQHDMKNALQVSKELAELKLNKSE